MPSIRKKRLLDKLGNLLQFYVEIVVFIRNQVCVHSLPLKMNIFRYFDLARNMSEKYSFECVKCYTSWFFYVKLQLDILLTFYINFLSVNKYAQGKFTLQQGKNIEIIGSKKLSTGTIQVLRAKNMQFSTHETPHLRSDSPFLYFHTQVFIGHQYLLILKNNQRQSLHRNINRDYRYHMAFFLSDPSSALCPDIPVRKPI